MILAAILLAGIELGGKYLLVWLAQQDKWWSPLRLLPPPGTYIIMVQGSKDGAFDQIIASVPGWRCTAQTGWQFVEDPNAQVERGFWGLGIVWVGLYKALYTRERRYSLWEQKKGSPDWDVVAKKRDEPYFFFQTVMAITAKGAETVGNFPVNVVLVATQRVINPVLAEFFAGKPEVQFTGAGESRAREYIGDRDIDQLRRDKDKPGDDFIDYMLTVNDGPRGIRESFGLEMINPYFVLMDLVSGDADYARATRIKEIKKREADAAEEDARGIRTLGNARADAIKAVGAAYNASGVPDFAIADAIREAKPSVVSIGREGAGVVIPLPDKK